MNGAAMKHHWETLYQTKPSGQVSWYEQTPALSRDFICRLTTPQSAVVDIGCGAASLADELLREGYGDITVLDISNAALTVAKRRLGPQASRVLWVEADVRSWRPGKRHDLWHDRAAFHFLVDPADQRAYAGTLKAALQPNGVAIIGTFAPCGPEMCSGLPVQRHDAASILGVIGSGFELIETHNHDHVTPERTQQQFQFSVFRRVRD